MADRVASRDAPPWAPAAVGRRVLLVVEEPTRFIERNDERRAARVVAARVGRNKLGNAYPYLVLKLEHDLEWNGYRSSSADVSERSMNRTFEQLLAGKPIPVNIVLDRESLRRMESGADPSLDAVYLGFGTLTTDA